MCVWGWACGDVSVTSAEPMPVLTLSCVIPNSQDGHKLYDTIVLIATFNPTKSCYSLKKATWAYLTSSTCLASKHQCPGNILKKHDIAPVL